VSFEIHLDYLLKFVLNDLAFAPKDSLQKFSVYTSWIENEFKNEIPEYVDNSKSSLIDDRSTLVFELNGKRIEVTMPKGLSSAGVKQKKTSCGKASKN